MVRPTPASDVREPRAVGRRRPRALLAVTGVLLALVGSACTPGSGSSNAQPSTSSTTTSGRSCANPASPTTVAYKTVPGVDRNLTSLDVHAPSAPCAASVVMWVHGGGYRIGDKSNQVRDKIKLFNDHGWIFISVNYRLTQPGRPGSAQYPDHYDDVAAAVAWIHAHIAGYGGDPSRIALLGHSAGADIVSNVTTNPPYLQRQGLDLSAIRCAGPLDTEGFDKAAAAPAEKQQWTDALGNDPNYVVDTSASLHIAAGRGIPSTIGVSRGSVGRQRIETAYLDKLTAAGITARRIDARTLSHQQVNTQIGAPGDTVMTPPLVAFLTNCFAK